MSSNLTSPIHEIQILKSTQRLGTAGQSILRGKRQGMMPAVPMDEAGLEAGDRLSWHADGPGRMSIERIEEPRSLFEADQDRKTG